MAKEKKTNIQKAVERLILRLSHYEISKLGKIVKKIKKHEQPGE